MSDEKTEVKLTKQEANAELSKLVKEAYAAITSAERLADEYGLEFSFDLAYGMGGTYVSKKLREEENEYYRDDNDSGWYASSQSC